MAKTSTKTKKPMNRAQLAVTLLVAILVMVGANLVLFLSTPSSQEASSRAALFGVKKIVVEGNTRYDEEAIIGKSGITIGQSIFSVDKKEAAENVRQAFAYAESVTVDNKMAMDTIRITIEEAKPMGVVAGDGTWILVSTTGRGLTEWPMQSEKPLRYRYFKGVTAKEKKVGGQVMDDRSFTIVSTLLESLEGHKLEGVTQIDLTDKTDIQVNWKNQITFLMGNDINMDHKLAVIAAMLPQVLKTNGNDVRGTINVRGYSDPNVQNPPIVFRPEGLVTTTTAGKKPGSTTTTGGR